MSLLGGSNTIGGAGGAYRQGSLVFNAGVPVDGTSGTLFPVNTLLIDTTNHKIYINAGTVVSPLWKIVTSA